MTGISKDELQRVTLETLGKGAAVELFNHELQKAIADALDVNADPKATRQVQLTVKLLPTEDRAAAHLEAKVSTKLAGPSPVGTMVFIGMEGGEAVAYDRIQTTAFPADVTSISSRTAS
jgi:hypothetical protein